MTYKWGGGGLGESSTLLLVAYPLLVMSTDCRIDRSRSVVAVVVVVGVARIESSVQLRDEL